MGCASSDKPVDAVPNETDLATEIVIREGGGQLTADDVEIGNHLSDAISCDALVYVLRESIDVAEN